MSRASGEGRGPGVGVVPLGSSRNSGSAHYFILNRSGYTL